MSIKKMDIDEFYKEGYVQELNRQFLHPLGLALYISTDDASSEIKVGVLDDRADPEGIRFSDEIVTAESYKAKANFIKEQQDVRAAARLEALGYIIQPTS